MSDRASRTASRGGHSGTFSSRDLRNAPAHRRIGPRRVVAMVLSLATVAAATLAFGHARASAGIPSFDHVVTIVMTGHGYSDVIANAGAPYAGGLALDNALASNYFALSHQGLPNYIALTGGSASSIRSDADPIPGGSLGGPSIVDRVEASGRTWMAYMDGMASPCLLHDSEGYAVRHDPFVYYRSVAGDPRRCAAHVVPYTQFEYDRARIANYVWITPSMCAGNRTCSVEDSDSWLTLNVPPLVGALSGSNYLIDIVWDHDDGGTNQVAQIVLGPSVRRGQVSSRYTHLSSLRTIEDAWGLAPLGAGDRNAVAESEYFQTSTATAAPDEPAPMQSDDGAPPVGDAPAATDTPTPTPAVATPEKTMSPPTGATTAAGGSSVDAQGTAPQALRDLIDAQLRSPAPPPPRP